MPPRPCIFEYIYFARPDSVIGGRNVYDVRKNMGAQLAKESPASADVIVPVPDSGVPAAMGFSQASGIPYEMGIIRNHYVGRTFIEPTQQIRQLGVRLKHSANRAVVNGKRIVLVDDSIVRGTTSLKIVQMMRDAGATEVHFRNLIAADHASGLLRHRHARPRQAPRRDAFARGNAEIHRRGFARLPVDRRHLQGDGLREPRSASSAIHRSLLHGRIPDSADRSDRTAEPATAVVAARRGGLNAKLVGSAKRSVPIVSLIDRSAWARHLRALRWTSRAFAPAADRRA